MPGRSVKGSLAPLYHLLKDHNNNKSGVELTAVIIMVVFNLIERFKPHPVGGPQL